MNFYDTVTQMGYSVKKDNNVIDISKEDFYLNHEPLGTIHILFNLEEKKATGLVCPIRCFCDLDDMAHIYKLFRDMQRDLKFLADKSHYDIV